MTATPTRPRQGGLKAQERRTGLLLVTPALLAFAAVILVPFLQSMRLSLPPLGALILEPVEAVAPVVELEAEPQVAVVDGVSEAAAAGAQRASSPR